MSRRKSPSGLSLVELVLVMAVIGLLVTIAAPFRGQATDQTKDVVARANLRTVLLAQMELYEETGRFTADRHELLDFAPGLPLGEQGTAGSIYIVAGQSRSYAAVCLFTQGGTRWHTLFHSGSTGSSDALFGPRDCTRMMLEEQAESGRRKEPQSPRPGSGVMRFNASIGRDTTRGD